MNDKLLQGADEIPNELNGIYDTITLTQRRDITFPSIRGVNPDLVPELSEFRNAEYGTFTSITVTPQKFGMLLGVSREMLDDNEVNLIGHRAREGGRAHRELRRREMVKAISFFSTGPAKSTGIIGIRNHGAFYPEGGYTNFLSATALTWEEIIAESQRRLLSQTITVGDMTIGFPVRPNFILTNPHHQHAIQKVLNASITVAATGVGPQNAVGTNVAGTNIFFGQLPFQIYDPDLPTAQAFIGQSRRGLVMVNRDALAVETKENFRFDADDLKTRERFLPAVVEERFICDIQTTG